VDAYVSQLPYKLGIGDSLAGKLTFQQQLDLDFPFLVLNRCAASVADDNRRPGD
jgi:hypothetical protein